MPFPAIPPIFLSSDCYFHGLTRCTTPATNLMNEVKQSLESAPKCALPLLSAPTTRGKLDFSCLTLLEALMVAGRAATMFCVGARMRVPSQMRAFGVEKVSTASRKPKVSVRAQGTSDTTSVAVLGAGAAGLTAAYFAAAHGAKRVVVYERTSEAGKKILMSGGARCNVLPVSARVEDFVTESTPRKLKTSWQAGTSRGAGSGWKMTSA